MIPTKRTPFVAGTSPMNGVEMVSVATPGDNSSGVLVLPFPQLPFEIKNLYYMKGVELGKERGDAAKQAGIVEAAVCLNGSVVFDLDNGKEHFEVRLDSPDQMLIIQHPVYVVAHTFESRDTVVGCYVNTPYFTKAEDDYHLFTEDRSGFHGFVTS